MSVLIHVSATRPRRLAWGMLAVVILVAGLAWGWSVWSQPRLNVLIVTLDTTRADRIGCYGYQRALTPVLDGLAQRGVLFEQAYTPAPLTLPAHASLFTGLYPPEHGLRTNGKDALGSEIPTLATVLKGRGYDTAAFVASFVLDSKFGLERGFQTYDDDLTGTAPADEALHRNRPGDVVVDHALRWLEGRTAQPFLCWVHLYDPHAPYVEHQDLFGEQFKGRPYDAEIAFVDRQVARLLDFLKARQLTDRTLVIVVGDHGEGLEEHLERRHGQMLYQSTMHVPLIVSRPGSLPQGQRIATPVSLVDLSPTILKFTGGTLPGPISGQSLSGLMRGQALAPRGIYGTTDEPFFESGWSPLRSLTTDKWKYIRTTRPELYDLVADPAETRNLAVEQVAQMQALEQQLSDLEKTLTQRQGTAVQLSPAEQRRLASLGYLGGQSGRESVPSTVQLPDIKDMMPHYNALEDIRMLIDTDQLDEATRRLKVLTMAAPDYELAEISLGDVYLRQRNFDAATAVYRAVLKRNPESALAQCHLGDIAEAQGKYAAAMPHYLEALQREPDSAKLHYNLGRILALLGNDQEAIPHFETALELDPGYVFALVELGTAMVRQGQLAAALEYYETALQYDANTITAHLNAAMVLSRQSRNDEAIEHLQRAIQISPQDGQIQYQLGAFLSALGKKSEAVGYLQTALKLQPNHAEARELLDKLQEAEPPPK